MMWTRRQFGTALAAGLAMPLVPKGATAMPVYPLNTYGNVRLDGSGNGRVSLGPSGPAQQWQLSVAAVRVPNSTLEPQCNIYIGPQPTDEYFVDGTFTGSLDSTDSVANFPISSGDKIWAVWTGADPGALATLSVLGTYGK